VNELTDEGLAARLALGEAAALSILVQRHGRQIAGMLYRATGNQADTDDLFQEVWIRVARRVSSFDPARSFQAWLRTIAANLVIDWARRAALTRRIHHVDGGDGELARACDSDPDSERRLLEAEQREGLSKALAGLPDRLRHAVLLRYFD
jgi:RNA polymerase sigma-70 factor (ECF subfamily)